MKIRPKIHKFLEKIVMKDFSLGMSLGIGIFFAFFAIATNELLMEMTDRNLLFISTMTIALSALIGGRWSGLTSTVVTAVALTYAILRSPENSPAEIYFRMIAFSITGIVMTYVASIMKNSLQLIQSARSLSERAVKSRDEFIAMASHELRTPITSLAIRVQIARKTYTSNDRDFTRKDAFNLINYCHRSAGRLSILINNVLDISQIERKSLCLDLQLIDVREMINQTLEQIPLTDCERIHLSGDPGKFILDPLRIGQVLTNLITNALEYGKGKAIEVEANLIGESLQLTVSDQGEGISPELIESIFDQYKRATTTGAHKGMGLGLFISRSIAEAHYGSLKASSSLTKGTRFTLTLPAPTEVALRNELHTSVSSVP